MTQMRIQGKLKKKEWAAFRENEEYSLNDKCGKNLRFQMFLQEKYDDLNPQIVQIKCHMWLNIF